MAGAGRDTGRRHELTGKRKGAGQRQRKRKRISRTVLAMSRVGTQSKILPKRKRQTGSRRGRRTRRTTTMEGTTPTMEGTGRRQARTKRERKGVQGTVLDVLSMGAQPKKLPQRRTRSSKQC